jgi:hypothetical protein
MWLPANAQSPAAFTEDVVAGGVRVPAQPTGDDVQAPAAADLDTWHWQQYLLTWDLASKLGFAIGGVEGDFQSRVLVAEWSRSKTVKQAALEVRFGVTARLVVNVRSIDAEANLSLPFVAAEAQMNRAEAHANMTIEGYVGRKAGSLFPAFSTFDVESYVKLMEAMTSAKDVIGRDEANIRPVRLWCWGETTAPAGADATIAAVATAWALTRIARGNSLAETLDGYVESGDAIARTAIERVYASLDAGAGEGPAPDACDQARRLLRGYELHRPRAPDMG